jgi:hypothetical protein
VDVELAVDAMQVCKFRGGEGLTIVGDGPSEELEEV